MMRSRTVKIILLFLMLFLVLMLNSACFSQSPKQIGGSSPMVQSETTPDQVAVVGPHGHKIVIPEIKINRIGATSKPKPTVQPPPELPAPEPVPVKSVEQETPRAVSIPPEEPKNEAPSEPSPKLPVDNRHVNLPIPFDKEDFLKSFLIAAIAILTVGSLFSQGDRFVVIKDKKGKLRVIKANKATASTIAGPFNTKEAARRAKEQACPSVATKKSREHNNIIQLKFPILRTPRKMPVISVASSNSKHAGGSPHFRRAPGWSTISAEKMDGSRDQLTPLN